MNVMYEVLRQLDEWRHLPAYQLERRVDIFFGMFLPKVIEKMFRVHVDEVIPEFPLRKGLLGDQKSNQSVNVDFAVFGYDGKKERIILVELKTDIESLKRDQLEKMVKVRACPKALLDGVCKVAQHSDSKHKYAHLIWKLLELGCLRSGDSDIKNLDLKSSSRGLSAVFKGLCVADKWSQACIDLVVILPTKPKESDPPKVPKEIETILFPQFADILEEGNEPFGNQAVGVFADQLRNWARVPAGRVTPWPR